MRKWYPIKRNELILAMVPGMSVLALAACSSVPPAPVVEKPETPVQATERRAKAPAPTYNLTGYPPAVRDGYVDGCESKKGTPLARKDARRFVDDPQYAMGWNDGYSLCKK
jgi:hypothetical protein